MAACKSACSTLGFDAAQVKAGSASMRSLFITSDGIESMMQSLTSSEDTVPLILGSTHVVAKLQVAPIPFLTSPVFILRFKGSGSTAAHAQSRIAAELSASPNGHDDADGGDNDGSVEGSTAAHLGIESVKQGQDSGVSRAQKAGDNGSSASSSSSSSSAHRGTASAERTLVPASSAAGGASPSTPGSRSQHQMLGSPPAPRSSILASMVNQSGGAHPSFALNADVSLCPVMGG